MRDYYHNFGQVALGATSGAKVYCPNPEDTGALNSRSRFTRKHIGADSPLRLVGMNLAAMESIDCFAVGLCDDADNSGTYTELVRSGNSALGAPAYTRMIVTLKDHLQYRNAFFVGTSTGTLTTKNCMAFIESGPNIGQGDL
jgi:hypothetical protein